MLLETGLPQSQVRTLSTAIASSLRAWHQPVRCTISLDSVRGLLGSKRASVRSLRACRTRQCLPPSYPQSMELSQSWKCRAKAPQWRADTAALQATRAWRVTTQIATAELARTTLKWREFRAISPYSTEEMISIERLSTLEYSKATNVRRAIRKSLNCLTLWVQRK